MSILGLLVRKLTVSRMAAFWRSCQLLLELPCRRPPSFLAMEVIDLGSLNDHFFVIRLEDGELAAVGIMTSITARIISDYVINEILYALVHELVGFTRSKEECIGGSNFRPAILVANLAATNEVLLTNTVMDLVSGSGVVFINKGSFSKERLSENRQLFAAV